LNTQLFQENLATYLRGWGKLPLQFIRKSKSERIIKIGRILPLS